MTTLRPVALALILVAAAGCAPRTVTPETRPPGGSPKPGLGWLRTDLAACFAPAAFDNAVWGVSYGRSRPARCCSSAIRARS